MVEKVDVLSKGVAEKSALVEKVVVLSAGRYDAPCF